MTFAEYRDRKYDIEREYTFYHHLKQMKFLRPENEPTLERLTCLHNIIQNLEKEAIIDKIKTLDKSFLM